MTIPMSKQDAEMEQYDVCESVDLKDESGRKAEAAIQRAYRTLISIPHLPFALTAEIESGLLAMLLTLNEFRSVVAQSPKDEDVRTFSNLSPLAPKDELKSIIKVPSVNELFGYDETQETRLGEKEVKGDGDRDGESDTDYDEF